MRVTEFKLLTMSDDKYIRRTKKSIYKRNISKRN